jgi:RNA polymerase sigma factor (sigma-70 family)
MEKGAWMDQGRHGQSGDTSEPLRDASSARWMQIWASRQILLNLARRSGSFADAEDAVQEAMLRAAERPEIGQEHLRAWLCAVTMRLCMDSHRRGTAEARRWERVSAQAVVQRLGQYIEDDICERLEAVWIAALAVDVLPPRQVQALWLAAVGCSVQQIAGHLGVRQRAAESLLARARRTLRAIHGTDLESRNEHQRGPRAGGRSKPGVTHIRRCTDVLPGGNG